MIAAWGVDSHTIAAASQAVNLGLADVTLVGDEAMIEDACFGIESSFIKSSISLYLRSSFNNHLCDLHLVIIILVGIAEGLVEQAANLLTQLAENALVALYILILVVILEAIVYGC